MGRTFDTGYLRNIIAYDASGNVGLGGAVDATYKLKVTGAMQVTGAGVFGGTVTANSTSGVSGAFVSNTFFGSIDLENTGGAVAGKWNLQSVSGAQVGATAGSSFGIYSYAASAYRLFITGAGNVGIGTSSPSEKLTINGGLGFQFSGTQNWHIASNASNNLSFTRSGISDRMVITSDGNVGIGLSNPLGSKLTVMGDITVNIGQGFYTNTYYSDGFKYLSNGPAGYIAMNSGDGSFSFTTASSGTAGSAATLTERMRITSGGYLKASNDGTYNGSTGSYHELRNNLNDWMLFATNTNSIPFGFLIKYTAASPNGTSNRFIVCADSTNDRFEVRSNGNVLNTNGSYGAYSDIKLKENIVDATPKLNKLLKVKIRNYNLIGEETKQIGVIAQELEQIFPSMIEESADTIKDEETGEMIELGTTTKSVKYSVFVPMLIKAIQEQQAQIESQATRIAYLENK